MYFFQFVAVTKEDFWRHTKMHIKPEKMLNCPKCPFVTEYKHHLEYHLRNHFGSKPFKCPSCSYTCVNKSMLNSHMKSHTNIYQYRCQDCNYATKVKTAIIIFSLDGVHCKIEFSIAVLPLPQTPFEEIQPQTSHGLELRRYPQPLAHHRCLRNSTRPQEKTRR